MRRALMAMFVVTLMMLGRPASISGQEAPLALKMDLVVPATLADERRPTSTCVYLPIEASTVKVSRRPLVAEAGGNRSVYMSIRPYTSTAYPYVERVNVSSDLSLTIPDIGAETCFEFENPMGAFESQGVAQSYKYFAQVVSLEVR